MTVLELEVETLLELEPEEVARLVLLELNRRDDVRNQNDLYYLNVQSYVRNETASLSGEDRERCEDALMEAWSWLEREGLLANKMSQGSEFYFVTRRGKALRDTRSWQSYRHSDLLPKRLLHPSISTKVWSTFLRGDYETAIFQAFKQVEVAVRAAGGFGDTDLGTDLMRKAFEPAHGPLTDNAAPTAERQAIGHLFAGAIGYYKNPQSHRNVIIDDPTEAVEMLVMASHLLRIIGERDQS